MIVPTREKNFESGQTTRPLELIDTSNIRRKRQTKQYKIPHGYVLETTWGRAANKQTVCCEIDYIDGAPQFRIKYGPNFQYVISSTKSPSNATLIYERALKPETKLFFRVLLYLGIYHQSDEVKLKAMEFSVNQIDFQVNFGYEDQVKKNSQIQSVVKAVDQGQISRDSYRELAAVEHHLPRDNSVSNERIAITNYMNNIIKISLVNKKEKNELEDIKESEKSDIMNFEIVQEVVNTIGLGIRRSIKDILYYIIPQLQKQDILKSSDPIIHLRISGDGRNVGKKIKHVMVTFMILNHESRHHHADYYYTIILYPGTENYNTLKFILDPLCNELRSLKKFGLKISGILWKFELYFNADWKFLAICLGLNSANSKYFCPWYLCSKDQNGDLNKDWHIEKKYEINCNKL
ncbi:841_t:CDS:2 [Funneliformis mosseae]|uniref:841_t:CDS:1 n=1 Tax=Funneliformis mosseae TaxID=27381 RepID=A0A9N9EN19_FUNMO|nr:841_t:CDS:2 [Funneliformis mosseae]